jgi:hypothetical protein
VSDFGLTKMPKGRKDHACAWCGQTIPKGEQHIHFTGVWQGDFQDWRMHDECHNLASDTGELQEGFNLYDNERPGK